MLRRLSPELKLSIARVNPAIWLQINKDWRELILSNSSLNDSSVINLNYINRYDFRLLLHNRQASRAALLVLAIRLDYFDEFERLVTTNPQLICYRNWLPFRTTIRLGKMRFFNHLTRFVGSNLPVRKWVPELTLAINRGHDDMVKIILNDYNLSIYIIHLLYPIITQSKSTLLSLLLQSVSMSRTLSLKGYEESVADLFRKCLNWSLSRKFYSITNLLMGWLGLKMIPEPPISPRFDFVILQCLRTM